MFGTRVIQINFRISAHINLASEKMLNSFNIEGLTIDKILERKGFNRKTHVDIGGLVRNWKIKTPRVSQKIDVPWITHVYPQIWLKSGSNLAKRFVKPGSFLQARDIPNPEITILGYENRNPQFVCRI